MPGVTTLHQDSETSSKPSFFRGHHWGCLSLLGQAHGKRFALPLWAEIHPEDSQDSRATRLVNVATEIGLRWGRPIFLVLDAFFAVGPVFAAAAASQDALHILTRAKKNVVAYQQPPRPRRHRRGRRRLYGRKLKLVKLFDARPQAFLSAEAVVYQKKETVNRSSPRSRICSAAWRITSGPSISRLSLGALDAVCTRLRSLPAPNAPPTRWPPSRSSWRYTASSWARFNSWRLSTPTPSANTLTVGYALPPA
jgi:hypothetical protein